LAPTLDDDAIYHARNIDLRDFTCFAFSDTLEGLKMTDQNEQIPFLDVDALLERSQPPARVGWFWYGAGIFLLIVLLSAYVNSRSPQMAVAVRALSAVMMFGLMAAIGIITWFTVRAQRAQMMQLEAIEELVALRRWPQAGILLEGLLSSPTRSPAARVQGLIYLTSVLARYHRFEDAIKVQNHLLDDAHLDAGTAHALQLARAMAMLRSDHLFDADRAIAELRREARRVEPSEADAAQSRPEAGSAGLAMIEIYRDVKTGHPAEAIEQFSASLEVLRRQLGHRVGDAYALAARAYDLMGQTASAQQAYENATFLSPLEELHRRYPEVQSLAEKYRPTIAPSEAA
jgi:hypothetical protein